MRQDLLARAMREALPAESLRRLEERRSSGSAGPRRRTKGAHSKTTIMAMKYADGVLCAADRKTSGWGYSIMSQDSVKIYKVSAFSVLLGCGSVADIQLAEKTLGEANEEFREDNEFPLTMDAQANHLAMLCRWWNYWYGENFSLSTILAGVDAYGTDIYEIDQDGSTLVRRDYTATGSGGFRAEDQLDARYEDDLSLSRALEVAMHAMYHAGLRDSGSSPPIIATPSVATMNLRSGVRFLPDETVERALGRVLLTKRDVSRPMARALLQGRNR